MVRYIDAGKFHEWVYPNWSYCAQNDDDFHEAIDAQPTEDVAPVIHAHWIRTPSLEDYQSDIECSNCEYDFTVDRICIEDYLRCPHCGAVMDEVEKDET